MSAVRSAVAFIEKTSCCVIAIDPLGACVSLPTVLVKSTFPEFILDEGKLYEAGFTNALFNLIVSFGDIESRNVSLRSRVSCFITSHRLLSLQFRHDYDSNCIVPVFIVD